MNEEYIKGRGAQIKPDNPFTRLSLTKEVTEGIDDHKNGRAYTQVYYDRPKKIVSENDSPDIRLPLSVNPYQGCEHGCIYCYARNSHTYWGFDSGLDFESKIVAKPNAPELLEKTLTSRNWKPAPIMLSGNTDCYQPLERRLRLTRDMLKVFLKYRHPVGVITKNALILRDLDLLSQLADKGLVHVFISVTTLEERLRKVMEPRTSTGLKRLETISALTENGIPVGAMIAPIIPSLNSDEIPTLFKETANHGALTAAYTVIRLNGQDGILFKDWLYKNFPERGAKVWRQIESLHGGKVNDSQWGRRLTGAGALSFMIKQEIALYKKRYFGHREMPAYNLGIYRKSGQPTLFD
jgi:DNA repair photolyase